MAVRSLLLAGALSMGCSASKKDTVTPQITYAPASAEWRAAAQVAVSALQATWHDATVLRMHAAPVEALPYLVEVTYAIEGEGGDRNSRLYVLDGQLVRRWTPALRVAALRQMGLPARRPPAQALARFLDSTQLFRQRGFPGIWSDGRLRAGVEISDGGTADAAWLRIDYPVARDGGAGEGAPGDALHRLSVRFDGRAITVTPSVVRP